MSKPLSIILGVGALDGVGGALCRRAAQAGHHVIIVGRTAGKIDDVARHLASTGATATAKVVDLTAEEQVTGLFEEVDRMGGELEFVAYNAGNAFRHDTFTMDASYFEAAWRVCCLGGFIAGREAGRRLLASGRGTLLFTGATASVRARPPFLAFASAKAGLRAVAAGLARELGPAGVHVAHVIIDGGIDGAIINQRMPGRRGMAGVNGMLKPEAIAESYWQLHRQHPSAWTFELDLRPFKETF